jgi:hypothetical protein
MLFDGRFGSVNQHVGKIIPRYTRRLHDWGV